MLTVGDKFPAFSLKATVSREKGKEFATLDSKSYQGKWLVVFAWPLDFTFVCPTEIAEFGRKDGDFKDRDAQILGLSHDSEFVHLAWRNQHEDLRDLPFPMLADTRHELTTALGIRHPKSGLPLRATFLVDTEGIIRHVTVNDLSVGRNIDETLRTLDAFQTGELCPCNWQAGEETLKV